MEGTSSNPNEEKERRRSLLDRSREAFNGAMGRIAQLQQGEREKVIVSGYDSQIVPTSATTDGGEGGGDSPRPELEEGAAPSVRSADIQPSAGQHEVPDRVPYEPLTFPTGLDGAAGQRGPQQAAKMDKPSMASAVATPSPSSSRLTEQRIRELEQQLTESERQLAAEAHKTGSLVRALRTYTDVDRTNSLEEGREAEEGFDARGRRDSESRITRLAEYENLKQQHDRLSHGPPRHHHPRAENLDFGSGQASRLAPDMSPVAYQSAFFSPHYQATVAREGSQHIGGATMAGRGEKPRPVRGVSPQRSKPPGACPDRRARRYSCVQQRDRPSPARRCTWHLQRRHSTSSPSRSTCR